MENSSLPRREFLRILAAAFPAAAIDWTRFLSAMAGPKTLMSTMRSLSVPVSAGSPVPRRSPGRDSRPL